MKSRRSFIGRKIEAVAQLVGDGLKLARDERVAVAGMEPTEGIALGEDTPGQRVIVSVKLDDHADQDIVLRGDAGGEPIEILLRDHSRSAPAKRNDQDAIAERLLLARDEAEASEPPNSGHRLSGVAK